MNVISYSLYGSDPKYLVGAVRNATLVKYFYPSWQARFYIGNSIPDSISEALMREGAEVVRCNGPENASAMFWRYQSLFDDEVDRVIIRDADSRPGVREASAVKDWVDSGKSLHIMRDHPAHYCPILGGLWGVTNKSIRGLAKVFEIATPNGYYGEDQEFLGKHVYVLLKRDALIHDSVFWFEVNRKSFPRKRESGEFVGEVFDEFEQPRLEDRLVLKSFEGSHYRKWKARISSFVCGFDRG